MSSGHDNALDEGFQFPGVSKLAWRCIILFGLVCRKLPRPGMTGDSMSRWVWCCAELLDGEGTFLLTAYDNPAMLPWGSFQAS